MNSATGGQGVLTTLLTYNYVNSTPLKCVMAGVDFDKVRVSCFEKKIDTLQVCAMPESAVAKSDRYWLDSSCADISLRFLSHRYLVGT